MLYVNGILLKVDETNEGQVLSTIKLAVTTEVEKIDRNKSCRICLNTYEKTDLFSLFSTNSMFQSLSVSAAIQECFQVTLEDQENFPRYVCVQCASSTLQAYTFKKCLLRSEDTLNSRLINQLPVEDINEILLCESDVKFEDLDDESCKLSIISDHNYSKDVVSDTILSTPLTREETDEQDIVEKNVDDKLENHEIPEKPKKYSMKPLSSHLEKWWRKSNGPPYICQICSREYGTKYNAFYTHIRTHFISKPACPYCSKRFPYDKLLIHIRSHTNEKPFSCTQCPAKFSLQGNLNRHLVCHTGEKPYKCDICGKGFTQNSSMQGHKQTHDGVTQIICEFCGKSFGSTNYYRFHLYKIHKKPLDDMLRKNDEDRPYKCSTCHRVFRTLKSLNQHTRVHDDDNGNSYACDICNAVFRLHTVYKAHKFLHEVQMLDDASNVPDCQFCFSTFSKKTDLESHLLDHIQKPFTCEYCNKSFTRNIRLSYHLRQHTEERPYSCNQCGKMFRNPTTLSQHQKIHTGRKSYLCKICSRGFIQQQQLTSHMLTHTGEKKYVCHYCGKAFALNGNLTVHIRRHTGDTPFYCGICGKGFHDSSSRKKHMLWKHNSTCKTQILNEQNV